MEKRLYSRITIKEECSFYLQNCNSKEREVIALVWDISEDGISFLITDPSHIETIKKLNIGDEISFTLAHEIEMLKGPEVCIASATGKIIRTDSREDGMIIGCKVFATRDYEDFISGVRLSIFQNSFIH